MGKISEKLSDDIKAFPYEGLFSKRTKEALDAKERYSRLPRIKFEYNFNKTDKLLGNPILIDELEKNNIKDLLVITRPRGTNICEIPEKYCETFLHLLENR